MSRVSRTKSSTTGERGYLKEVNIKADRPTAKVALERMNAALQVGRSFGAGAVKLIHGYGSTGTGGRIRTAVRAELARQLRAGRIRACICGEEFTIFTPAVCEAFLRCPSLREDPDLERCNPGITIVVL